MKTGLPFKLGVFVIIVFGLLTVGMLLYKPIKYHYWRGKLDSQDKAIRDKAVKKLVELAPSYLDRITSDCLESNRYSPGLAAVLAKSGNFNFERLSFGDFLTFAGLAGRQEVIGELPENYAERIRSRIEKLRPKERNKRHYDTFFLYALPPPVKVKPDKTASNVTMTSLRFSAGAQIKPDGYWYSEDGTRDGDLITTGLTILSFLGYGQTHRHGKYKRVVRAGLTFLWKSRDAGGKFSDDTVVHAVCTEALCEAYAVTRDNMLKKHCLDTLKNLHKRQLPCGGFPAVEGGKTPDPKSTFRAVLASKAAKMGKLEFDDGVFTRVLEYIDDSGLLLSEKPEDLNITAGAALVYIFCGRKRSHPSVRTAFATLDKHLPSWENRRDIEYLHFGTYAKFQQGGDPWKKWTEAMKKTLLPKQHGENKRLEGSWDQVMGPASRKYGRNYTTALCTLTLEIWYRYARANVRWGNR